MGLTLKRFIVRELVPDEADEWWKLKQVQRALKVLASVLVALSFLDRNTPSSTTFTTSLTSLYLLRV